MQTVHLKEHYAFLGADGRDPRLDIYLTPGERSLGPVLLICPGGAYLFCSDTEAEPVADRFLPLGYRVFVLHYSVEPNRFPCQLIEVAAAFDYIKANALHLGCDMKRTAIIGFSAGGHLVSHYVNACRGPQVSAFFPEAHRVHASVLCYPVISTDVRIAHKNSFKYLLGHFPEGAEAERFSTDKLVTAQTPPTFLWHTAADENVPVENSLYYARALSRQKIPYELHIYPFGIHGLSTVDSALNSALTPEVLRAGRWIESAASWLELMLHRAADTR